MRTEGEFTFPIPLRCAPPVAWLAFSLLLGFLLAPVHAAIAAAGPEGGIGQAEIVVSRVQGLLGEITRELAIRDNVYSEEVIETGAESATRLRFLDGTQLAMGPSSQVTLDRYVYDPNAGTGQLAMNFVRGILEFVSGSLSHESYDLRTSFAHLSVRGTRIAIADNVIAVSEGSVLVRLNDGREFLLGRSECLVRESDGTWRQLAGDACDVYLIGYRAMLALLASAVQPGPGQNVWPNPLQRLGYVSPDRNANQPASRD